jgi:hypothetical protein
VGRLGTTACTLAISAAALAACPGAHARDVEDPLGSVELTKDDRAQITSLLERLAAAMQKADAAAIGELLAPSLSSSERSRIVSAARSEFEKTTYPKYEFDTKGEFVAEEIGPYEIKVIVVASFEYESRVPGGGMAGADVNSYPFRFAEGEDGWRISGSDLFEQFTALRFEQVLGWLFLSGFVALLVAFFWGWMALDAWMRFKRVRYGLLVIISTPVGAALYFFAVYLRRRFVGREE